MKIPEDIQKAIKSLSDAVGVPTNVLLDDLKEIIKTNEQIQLMDKDTFKIRFAWANLYRKHTIAGNEGEFYVMPLLHPNPLEITTAKGERMWIGEFSALVQKITKDEQGKVEIGEPTYGAGTLFRDGAKALQDLERDKVYKTALIFEETDNGYGLSSDKATFTEVDHKMPITFKEYFEKEIEPKHLDVLLGDMDLNKSEKPTDIRVLTVDTFDYDAGKGADGREFGYYDMTDSSISGKNYRMFLHPKDMEWEKGSQLKIGVRIDFNKRKELMTSPHFIVPTGFAFKREFETKAVMPQETVDTTEEKKEETESKESEEEVSFEI